MPSRAGKVHLKSTPEQLQAAGLLLENAPPRGGGIGIPPLCDVLDLPAIFGNARPVEIEIGPGKGAFLLRRAAARPEVNFLGIEWAWTHALYVADRARRAGLTNVRLLSADAEAVVRGRLADGSVWRVHIYFPDPWPKRKHHRRRLVKPEFLQQVRRVLRLGGQVSVVTDHAEYFRQIELAFAAVEGLMRVPFRPEEPATGNRQPATDGQGANTDENQETFVGSNFERKYAAAGRRFQAISAVRYL